MYIRVVWVGHRGERVRGAKRMVEKGAMGEDVSG